MNKIQINKGIILFSLLTFITYHAPSWAMDDLSNAALMGDKTKLKELIAKGVDAKGSKGGMALYYAAMNGKYETAEILIANGANVNYQEPINGFTPLHEVVSYLGSKPTPPGGERPPMDILVAQNKKKVAELLIAHNADVNAKSKGGITPLQKVANKDLAELLIIHGANVNALTNANDTSPLSSAAFDNPEVVEVLVQHGANVNFRNQAGITPLHLSVSNNQKKIVEFLIRHGANMDVKDRDGETPLNIAIRNNSNELVTLLMKNGEKLNAKPKYGLTELHWAVSQNNKSMVEQLLANGAQLSTRDQYGRTPIALAVQNNNRELVELLIKYGSGVNEKGQDGTPLIFGTRDKEVLELLLINGVNGNVKDTNGNSLLWYVCYDKKLTEILLKHGADINIKNSEGRSVLHLASRFARDIVAKRLVAKGANVNALDNLGQTPLFNVVMSYERHFDKALPQATRALAASPQSTSTKKLQLNTPGMVVTNAKGSGESQVAETLQKKSDSKLANLASEPPPISSTDDLNNQFPVGFDVSNSNATFKLLIAHGAVVSAVDSQGQTLLHVAPTQDIAAILLKQGISVNAKRTDGATALHIATEYGRKAVVQVLIAHSADVNAATNDGASPLHISTDAEIVKLLIASGAKVDATDKNGNTPLFLVEVPEVAEILLQHGTTLNFRNNLSQTPLLYAIRNYIKKLPEISIRRNSMGSFTVGEPSARDKVINVLLDHGADVNLYDKEDYMPLFYVREAIKNPSYAGFVTQLKVVESLLLAHGAKLEKFERKKDTQSNSNFLVQSPLSDAITKNNIKKAIELIKLGADVNQKNGYGNPIIHQAVSDGNPELVELLISKGADVNAKGQFDRVALHYANKKGMAKILLAQGAIVDAPTNNGETPLHWAAQGVNGFGKQVDLAEFAETLIANSADVNKKTGEGRSYRTPLSYAAEANNLPVARVLLAHGADVEGGGSSPLSYAGSNGDYVEMAQFLVENGAKVNQPSPTGWYPLMTAAGRGNIKVTNYLLDKGAAPNAANEAGMTALYMSAGSDYGAAAAETLMQHGANPNARIANGQTPLHQAASQSSAKVVEVLLKYKADVNAGDNDSETPLHVAIRYGNNDKRKAVVKLLLKSGASVNKRSTRDGTTPLFNAISRGDIEITQLIVEHGADLNISGAVGNIALYLARDSKAITELLKAHGAH